MKGEHQGCPLSQGFTEEAALLKDQVVLGFRDYCNYLGYYEQFVEMEFKDNNCFGAKKKKFKIHAHHW